MYYAILKPDQKIAKRFTIRGCSKCVGRFVQQSTCIAKFAIVTLQMEQTAAAKLNDHKVEIIWEVALNKFSSEIEETIFDGVVSGVKEFTHPYDRGLGALTSCTIRVLDAEWDRVDSSQKCYAIATVWAIRDCLEQAGTFQLKSGGFFGL